MTGRARLAAAVGASGCSHASTRPGSSRRPMSVWRSGLRHWPRSRRAGGAGRRVRRCGRCAAARCASICASFAGAGRSRDLPWPAADEWLAAVAASPLARHAARAAPVRTTALPRPVLARGAAGRRRSAGDAVRRRRRQPRADVGRLFPARLRRAAAAAEIALTQRLTVLTGGPGTGKTTTVARLLALLAEQARWRAAAADRAGGADRQGGGPAAGGGAGRGRRTGRPVDRQRGCRACGPPRCTDCSGQRPGHLVAVPAPPRQPAAARRDRRRRDVDGVADDDGAAAGGGAPGGPAAARRRSGPAGIGGGGRGAGRPGRRARRTRRRTDRRAEDVAPVRRVDRRRWPSAIRDGDADARRSRCCARAGSTSSGSTPTIRQTRLRNVLLPQALAAARSRRARRRRDGAGDARRASAAVRAPARAARRSALEPPGRALADRGDG